MARRNYPVYKKKPFDESTLIDTFNYGDLKLGLTKKAIRRYHKATNEWTILYHGLYNNLEERWIAKTINWEKVKDMMHKFDMQSPMMMATYWDQEIDFGVKKKPFPFHRHYRINLEKMLHSGCFTPKKAQLFIEYAKSLRLDRTLLTGVSEEDVEGDE
jgi:hypothetical protein